MIKIYNTNFAYTGTTDIQHKYFSSPETCNTLVCGLLSAMEAKDPTATMKKSSEGVTGFTFLCTVPSTSVKGEFEVDTIPTVLKWQDETQCKVEQFGAQFFKFLGFQAPLSYFFDAKNQVIRQLLKHSLKESPAMESLAGQISCLAMPRLHSNNLAHVAKHGLFLKLEKSDQKKMIQEFGRIAVMDLLIGNDDRFIAFPSFDKPLLLPEGRVNTGNVLVHIDSKNRVQGIFPIDNCPSSRLLKKERKSSGGFDLEGGLFGETEESEEVPSSFQKSPPSTEINPAPEDEVKALHHVFIDFYKNPEKYADQFTEKFLIEMKIPFKEGEDLKSLIRSAFLEGIHNQLLLIKPRGRSLEEQVISWDLLKKGEVHVQKLLIHNLKFLTEQI